MSYRQPALAERQPNAAQTAGGRRRSFTESARRAQILAEAVQVVAEVGYARASLGLIAQRLEISKGVISYHFKSKEELIGVIIETTLDQAATFMNRWLEGATGPSQLLARYIDGGIAFLGSHRDAVIALIEIYNARVADYSPHSTSFIGGLQELLEQGQREGEFRQFSSRVMATTIRAAIEMVPHSMVANPDMDLEEYARELVALFHEATATAENRGLQPGIHLRA